MADGKWWFNGGWMVMAYGDYWPSGNLSYNYAKIHHFSWTNSLFLWPWLQWLCSSHYQRVNPIIIPLKHHFPMVLLWLADGCLEVVCWLVAWSLPGRFCWPLWVWSWVPGSQVWQPDLSWTKLGYSLVIKNGRGWEAPISLRNSCKIISVAMEGNYHLRCWMIGKSG